MLALELLASRDVKENETYHIAPKECRVEAKSPRETNVVQER